MPEAQFPLPPEVQQMRRAGLAAADRTNAREGLPPPCAYTRSLDELYIRGEITADEAVAKVLEYYRNDAK